MCFECCDCILMKEVEQKAREEGIVPFNKLARYEAEEVKGACDLGVPLYAIEATRFEFEAIRDTKCSAQVNLGKDVPAVLALLPERPEKERKKGYFGAQVEGWCFARRAEFTDPVDGWQILVDPQQRARGRPVRASPRGRRDSRRLVSSLRHRRWRVTTARAQAQVEVPRRSAKQYWSTELTS